MSTWRSRLSSSFPDLLADERGYGALTFAVGVMVIMLLAAATMASQTKYDLQLSRVEGEVTQVEELVVAEFTKAAAKVDSAAIANQIWPDQFPGDGLAASTDDPCTPTERWVPSLAYPIYCIQALPRQKITGTYYHVQMRVRYQAYAGADIKTVYGWIVTQGSGTVPRFRALYYLHDWCTKEFVATVPNCLKDL